MTTLDELLARDWRDEFSNLLCRHGLIIAVKRIDMPCPECRTERDA